MSVAARTVLRSPFPNDVVARHAGLADVLFVEQVTAVVDDGFIVVP
jgi:hypothetical protein